MTTKIEINNITYEQNENGYCYKTENGKKVRIGKAEYMKAQEEAEEVTLQQELDEAITTEELIADLNTETEDAIEAKVEEKAKKARKARKSKDIAFTYSENEEVVVTLTAKQVAFLKAITEDEYWENGIDSTLWIDILCDTVAEQFNAMAVGAMVSTLREKGLVVVCKEKLNGKNAKCILLTEQGKTVATALGLK